MAKYVVGCTIDDVPHIDAEYKKDYIRSIPQHERAARLRGEPSIGSGAVYPIDESEYVIDPIPIPPHWPRAFALDVGQYSACLWGAIDPNTGCMYVYDEKEWTLKDKGVDEAMPPMIAHAINSKGRWIRGVYDPAALQGSKSGDGTSLYKDYKKLGVNLVAKADNGIESGITRNINMILGGTMKIFKTCVGLRNEIRVLARDDHGRVKNKQKDHLADCWRYLSGTGYKIARSLNDIEEEEREDKSYDFDTRSDTTGY